MALFGPQKMASQDVGAALIIFYVDPLEQLQEDVVAAGGVSAQLMSERVDLCWTLKIRVTVFFSFTRLGVGKFTGSLAPASTSSGDTGFSRSPPNRLPLRTL